MGSKVVLKIRVIFFMTSHCGVRDGVIDRLFLTDREFSGVTNFRGYIFKRLSFLN